ncbi:SMI1/KNR4 family protein [Candidatus Jidaibacter acanthamoebae]|nr:SMI1/KNR4 family protein [Candidatus Jidaibacter acanthamoeba]
MKHIEVEECKNPITVDEILAAEETIGAKLPSDYVEHLLKYNGGHPDKDCYPLLEAIPYYNRITKAEAKSFSAEIAWFYAIHDGEYSNLLREYKFDGDRLPKGLIAIGKSSGGNLICISVGLRNYGKVYFWDHKGCVRLGEEEPWWDNVFLIANSFTDFINSLYFGDAEMNEKRNEAIKYIDIHDKYSLPYYINNGRKYAELMKVFFAKAPKDVEEFVVEKIKKNSDLILKYEVPSENKRYVRYITDKTGEYKNVIEDVDSYSSQGKPDAR